MNKAYPSRTNWENAPSENTPINDVNLNKIDSAVDEIDNRVISLDTTKATKTEVSNMIANVSFNETTGIFTFTRKNGSTFTVDTLLEKIIVNFGFDTTTQELIIYMEDGTTKRVDLSAFITQNEFLDTDTISVSVSREGEVYHSVKDGSILERHLQPNYLADMRVVKAGAEAAEEQSELYSEDSEAFAKGTRGGIPVNTSDVSYHNNSYYYSQKSYEYMMAWKGSLLPSGNILFANLPTQNIEYGVLYNITDGFVSDSRFADGGGYSYPAGTNVYWAKNNKWDVLYGKLTKELTQAQYDELSDQEKMNGTIYFISDANNNIPPATSTEYGLVIMDNSISATSQNAVQNKVIYSELSKKVGAKIEKGILLLQ